MKKLFAGILAISLALCGLPISAAQPSVPAAGKVQVAYASFVENSNALHRYDNSQTIQAICAALAGVSGAAANPVTNIKPADRVLELRLGEGEIMRYHIFAKAVNETHADQIVSQKISQGVVYQGIGYTGGTVSAAVNKLLDLLANQAEERGLLPFSLRRSDLQSVQIYHYIDHTYTEITWAGSLYYIADLLRVVLGEPIDSRPVTTADLDFGNPLNNPNELVLRLRDGTRINCLLYERGIELMPSNTSINVGLQQTYKTESKTYQQLLGYLNQSQSNSRPLWLGTMEPRHIASIQVTNPAGNVQKILKPGDAHFSSLIEELQTTGVDPLNMNKLDAFTDQSDAYDIRIEFLSGTNYAIRYGASLLEIKAADIDYIASYRISDARNTRLLGQIFAAK